MEQPMIVIKPIGRFGGLDNIHISLIIALILLFGLLLVVSYSKPILITNQTNTTNTTSQPINSESAILAVSERFLASYSNLNSSLSVLPYISNVSAANLSYLPASREWLVKIPAKNPGSDEAFIFSMLIEDTNTSMVIPLIQTVRPSKLTNNSVVSLGVVKLYGKYACSVQEPLQVYWFIDPYASGAVRSLFNATALENRFGSSVNVSIKIISTQATPSIAAAYGPANAELLGRYVFCAAKQRNFSSFVSNLNAMYAGSYIPEQLLRAISNSSSLDYSSLEACVSNSTQAISAQSLLADYYSITQAPIAIVNCEYMALPQTASQAVCYSNATLCN